MTERTIQLAIVNEIRATIVVAAPNYTPAGWWECDLWAVTRAGYAVEYEIKLNARDFKADAQKMKLRWTPDTGWTDTTKKHDAMAACPHRPSRFFYVMPEALALELRPLIPEWAGLGSVSATGRRVRFIKPAPKLGQAKATKREIRLCQCRMWYRYWNAITTIERMKNDRRRAAAMTRGTPA